MLFNSYVFIFLFLPITWITFFALNRLKFVFLAKCFLLVSSLFFYSYWNPKYLFLILISIVFNYALTVQIKEISEDRKKKFLFFIGLLFNLGLLGYFKYTDFLIENINLLTGFEFSTLSLVLPLGISFYTLQQVAYLVDVYQGVAGERKFIDYALFVSFFPQLIAGPIVHYDEVMPQFASLKSKIFNHQNFSKGLFVFTLGLGKKVLIADTLSPWVTEAFRTPETLHFFSAWGASLSYTLQLYFDFSGYSDMAIGLGYLFNIKIPQNFNSPLRAANINEFWARWHITLSIFIRTYIFTPIVKAMPKVNFFYSMIAMFLAMTIAGIWHGAGWTFLLYGVIHGLAIVIHHNWKKKKKKLSYFWGWLLTFNFVNVSFIVFRAPTLNHAKHVLLGMMGAQGFQIPKMGIGFLKNLGVKMGPYMTNDQNLQLAFIIFGMWAIFRVDNLSTRMNSFIPTVKWAVVTSIVFVLCIFGLNRVSEFIYFNF
jgi:alginate O-acetyltransferase complex protein AlgI